MQLGKYELIRRLAVGGMAELFLARVQGVVGFEKYCVLKKILPAFAESPDFIKMFLAEARLVALLHHPNIAQVYEFGVENDTYFFTMEYVPGRDLRKILNALTEQRVQLQLADVLHIAIGVSAGLHHAHEQRSTEGRALGIVHRDVSPANVIVTYEGNIKLVDFGIAKAAALGPGTIAGALKGKIPYMSPEQVRGENVDRRSDVFSIGTLLWELTVGEPLFKPSENEFSQLHAVEQAKVPPPTSVQPDYPPELEAIVMKALCRDPKDRFQTALELRIALEDFAYEARLALSSAKVSQMMEELFPSAQRPGNSTPGSSLAGLRIDPTAPGPGELTKPTGPAAPVTGPSAEYPRPRGQRTLGLLLFVAAGTAAVAGGLWYAAQQRPGGVGADTPAKSEAGAEAGGPVGAGAGAAALANGKAGGEGKPGGEGEPGADGSAGGEAPPSADKSADSEDKADGEGDASAGKARAAAKPDQTRADGKKGGDGEAEGDSDTDGADPAAPSDEPADAAPEPGGTEEGAEPRVAKGKSKRSRRRGGRGSGSKPSSPPPPADREPAAKSAAEKRKKAGSDIFMPTRRDRDGDGDGLK